MLVSVVIGTSICLVFLVWLTASATLARSAKPHPTSIPTRSHSTPYKATLLRLLATASQPPPNNKPSFCLPHKTKTIKQPPSPPRPSSLPSHPLTL